MFLGPFKALGRSKEAPPTTAALLAGGSAGRPRAGAGAGGPWGEGRRGQLAYLKGNRKIYGQAEVRAQRSPLWRGAPSPASEFTTAPRTGHVPPREADRSSQNLPPRKADSAAAVRGRARPGPEAPAALLAFTHPAGQ